MIPTLIRTEFARLTASRMSRIALVALMLVPVLYGGLYLWANRDPYASLDQVPAALVVADTGATLSGKAVHYGRDVADQIVASHDFDWTVVSASTAAKGVRDGRFDFTLTLPASFSKNLVSASSSSPTRASVDLTTNDTNSYLASTIAGQAALTVKSSIAARVSSAAAGQFLLGLNDIHDSLSSAASGASQLKSGAASAASGATSLARGTAQLAAGANQLAAGTAQVATGAKQVAAGNAQLVASAGTMAAQAKQLSGAISGIGAKISGQLTAAGVSQSTIDAVLADLAPIGAAAQSANGSLQAASGQISQLAAGSAQVASGAAQSASGAKQAATGAEQSASGASSLSQGLDQLQTGATSLSDGLVTGAAKVPSTDAAARAAQSAAIGNPVSVKTDAVTKATDYGAGLAPFFISLAAWIGIYALFLIVKPLSRRALTAVRRPIRIALAGWLAPAILGVVQMAAVFLIVALALRLDVGNPLATYGFMALASLTFAAIILALNAWLGSVGQFLGLVLMVVQLVTAGGTFPWQTLPGPLAALHHALPMSYAVDGLRQLMYGGSATTALSDALVLLCWLLGGVALTALAAVRMTRHRTLRDLRPSLIG
jgi:putative membrane protein